MEGRIGPRVVVRAGRAGGDLVELHLGLFQTQAELGAELLAEGLLPGAVQGVNRLIDVEGVGHQRVRRQGAGRGAARHAVLELQLRELQLVAGAQASAAGERTDIGAGEVPGVVVVGVVDPLIGVRRGRDQAADQGVVAVVAAAAVVTDLIGPVVTLFAHVADDTARGARELALEAAVRAAAIGRSDAAARGVGLEHVQHQAAGRDVDVIQVAIDLQPVGRAVVGRKADEDVVIGAAAVLGIALLQDRARRRAGTGADAIRLHGVGVVTHGQIAGQGQLVPGHHAVDADVPAVVVADVGADRAGLRRLGARAVRLGDQVDHAAAAVRAVGRRRVGHDLDPGVLVGRDLQDDLTAVLAGEQARGTAVDQDGDAGVTAQRDVAVRIDLDRGNVAQGVGQRAGRGLQVLGDAVADRVDRGADVVGARGDDHVADGGLLLRLGLLVGGRLVRGRRSRSGRLLLGRGWARRGRRLGLGRRDAGRQRQRDAGQQKKPEFGHGPDPESSGIVIAPVNALNTSRKGATSVTSSLFHYTFFTARHFLNAPSARGEMALRERPQGASVAAPCRSLIS